MLQVVYIFELRIAIASGLGGSRCTHRLKPLQTMEILKHRSPDHQALLRGFRGFASYGALALD